MLRVLRGKVRVPVMRLLNSVGLVDSPATEPVDRWAIDHPRPTELSQSDDETAETELAGQSRQGALVTV